jgi:hypothetical protein
VVTAAEGERLAILETQMQSVISDVSEIKSDVKTLVSGQMNALIALTADQAASRAHAQSRGELGVWVRSLLPLIVGVGSILLGLFNLFRS